MLKIPLHIPGLGLIHSNHTLVFLQNLCGTQTLECIKIKIRDLGTMPELLIHLRMEKVKKRRMG